MDKSTKFLFLAPSCAISQFYNRYLDNEQFRQECSTMNFHASAQFGVNLCDRIEENTTALRAAKEFSEYFSEECDQPSWLYEYAPKVNPTPTKKLKFITYARIIIPTFAVLSPRNEKIDNSYHGGSASYMMEMAIDCSNSIPDDVDFMEATGQYFGHLLHGENIDTPDWIRVIRDQFRK